MIDLSFLNKNELWESRLLSELDPLLENGFCELPDLWSREQVQQLLEHYQHNPLRPANLIHQQENTIRNDAIYWLDHAHPFDQFYLQWLNNLRQFLNRTLYAGLRYEEAHFAHYAPGSFYKAHVDNPKGQGNRIFSCVLYLNLDWQPQHGGQLKIWDLANEAHLITPTAGKVILFSSHLLHEVQTANQARYSITSWLRNDAQAI